MSEREESTAMSTVPLVDRPREKLARVGAEALGDNELVALLIGAGTRSRSALLVAQDVIAASDGVPGLARLGLDELCGIRGVGASRASRLLAAIEIGRRALYADPRQRPQMLTTEDLAAYLMPRYSGCRVERFGVMLLDQKQRVIRSTILSTGTIESSVSHPRDVFRVAMLGSASRVVVFHNHPSGDPTPSASDQLVTRRLAMAGELMGMDLMDHIILAGRTYYSFKRAGLL
jgi:DNA repair protein RadC